MASSVRQFTGASTVSGWAVLAIGTRRLALPQREVRQIDLVDDLRAAPAVAGAAVGLLLPREQGPDWPVYCLDESLALANDVGGRRLCVFFESPDGEGSSCVQGLLCNHVWSLANDNDIVPQPLAGCMHGPRSPARGIARFDAGVALVTGAGALAAYLDELKEVGDGRTR